MVKNYKVKHVKKILDKTYGGMNYPAAVAHNVKDYPGKQVILIAEKRKARIPGTIRHEVVEKNIMERMGPPYTMSKYRKAHAATLKFEKGKKGRR